MINVSDESKNLQLMVRMVVLIFQSTSSITSHRLIYSYFTFRHTYHHLELI
ncbi:hypothetical protein THOG11_60241 [Vibrio harveyi]|nr:hypothetical protein TH15OA1_430049 [Vibrio harveyi]CAH1575208.1 hypothetical protein THOD03_50241 [Vibrio harveyi]CAH1584498.1 hypothetical protein THOG11_60241 [Vibrio harveyi]CAK6712360.1 hypothetical protein HORM4_1120118 [Vibrio harveyi]